MDGSRALHAFTWDIPSMQRHLAVSMGASQTVWSLFRLSPYHALHTIAGYGGKLHPKPYTSLYFSGVHVVFHLLSFPTNNR